MSDLSANSVSSQPQIWTGASGGTSSMGSGGVQGTGGGHRHHHRSVADQVSQMGSAIDQAVSAGSMTSDQASSLKKELADITQTLSQNGQSSAATTAGATGQSGSLSQLSDADRKKVIGELQDVRKQVFSALNPQANGAAASNNSAVSALFSKLDTNNDGTIDKNEFTQFLAQIGATALGYNQQGTASTASSGLTGGTISITG